MKKKHLLSIFLVIYVLSVSIIIFQSQKKQEIRSRASAATILSFSPSTTYNTPIQIKKGDPVSLDIMINPGTNYVSIIKLQIQYDTSKFEGTGKNTFVINSTALPTFVEGPVIDTNMGNILVTASIGIDPSKAIKTPTKIATINLIASNFTNGNKTIVSIGTVSKVFSVAPSDNAYENVLATAIPAYYIINDSPNHTPVPTENLPTETPTPSATLTTSPPIPTPTLTPPISTPTPDPLATNFSSTICLDGIGNSGDSSNPNNNTFSNKSPIRLQRTILLSVYDTSNNLISHKSDVMSYNQSQGCFLGMTSMEKIIHPGSYIIKIKTEGFLQKKEPSVQYIPAVTKLSLLPLNLVAGDINNDNKIDILDYNLLMGCYSDILPPPSCDATKKGLSDLNDDNQVNQNDYNLFIREIPIQNGD